MRSVMLKVCLTFAALFFAAVVPHAALAAEVPTSPQNGIPLVIIRVAEQELKEEDGDRYGTIADMNGDPDHNIRCHGTVEILLPEGYASEYGGTVPAGPIELKYIRGRGNTTWGMAKKPYKIKLKNETDLFRMGTADEWGLIANFMDETLLKNRLTYWLGQQLRWEETPQMVPCDLVMIGSESGSTYLGSYCLSELVSLGDGRVDIKKPKKDTISEEGEPNITGGYLLSFYTDGQNSDEPRSTVFKTKAGIEMMNKDPEYDDTSEPLTAGQVAQRSYIRNYIQEVEDLIVNSPQITPQIHEQIAAKMDLESAADYWLIQEFSRNGDGFETSSTYLYKKRNGKLYWGPLWDFDISYGEYPIDDPGENEGTKGFNNTDMLWIDHLRQKDPQFIDILEERWRIMNSKLIDLTKDGGVIDDYKEEIAASEADDEKIWKSSSEDPEDEEGVPGGRLTYDEYVNNLKGWINSRRIWINNNFDDIGKVYATVTFKADGQVVKTCPARIEHSLDGDDVPDPPEKEGCVFAGWFEEDSDETPVMTIKEDTVFVARYVSEEEAVAPTALYFYQYELWASVRDEETPYPTEQIVPEDVTDQRITWTSSDPSVAEIGPEGIVPKSVGTTIITGTLYNGVSNSVTLHIYDPAKTTKVDPAAIIPAQAHLTLKAGEQTQIRYTLQPGGVPLNSDTVSFDAEDPSVLDITSGSGVIRGLKAGTTTVTLSLYYGGVDDPDDDQKTLTATCTVTVTEDPKICTITYDLNGGTLDGKTGKITEQHKKGDVIKVMKAPTRAGYDFAYWEGSRLYPGEDYTVQDDHTIKAVWTKASSEDKADSGSGSSPGTKKNSRAAVSPKAVRTINKAGTAKTGDRDKVVIWTVCLMISTAAIAWIVRRKRRKI